MQAIVGSCKGSRDSVLSGMKFWKWFALNVLGWRGNVLPPTGKSAAVVPSVQESRDIWELSVICESGM